MANFETNDLDFEKIKNHWIMTSKALYVKIYKKHAPTIHNLYRLAELCEIELTDEYSDWLDTITSFNINARYDDYKNEFYNLCTREYARLWIDRIQELRKWIRQML